MQGMRLGEVLDVSEEVQDVMKCVPVDTVDATCATFCIQLWDYRNICREMIYILYRRYRRILHPSSKYCHFASVYVGMPSVHELILTGKRHKLTIENIHNSGKPQRKL
jgi:uncharacterized Fe-S cluster-containing protein